MTATHDNKSTVVYWHRVLPPLDAGAKPGAGPGTAPSPSANPPAAPAQ